jgi:hypothetical protein
MAETIFVVSGTETLYMARRLPAREAEDFGCEGSNLMLTSVKRQGPHLHGRFRGTEGIRARFVPWGDGSEGTFALAGYFCEV